MIPLMEVAGVLLVVTLLAVLVKSCFFSDPRSSRKMKATTRGVKVQEKKPRRRVPEAIRFEAESEVGEPQAEAMPLMYPQQPAYSREPQQPAYMGTPQGSVQMHQSPVQMP